MGNIPLEPISQQGILVIGDLFIDENWVMAKTDNYSSTEVGEVHYTNMPVSEKSYIWSVCGIANVLKVFMGNLEDSSTTTEKNPPISSKYQMYGAGIWNQEDEEIMKCILCGKCKPTNGTDLNNNTCPIKNKKLGFTPLTLVKKLPAEAATCVYKTDAEHFPCKLINLAEDNKEAATTNRIYRIYEGYQSVSPKLKYRYDWQHELAESEISDEKLKLLPQNNIAAIIVVDHGKGMINEKVISYLLAKYETADWYVRTKINKPKWMNKFLERGKEIRFNMVDEQLIVNMYDKRKWIYKTELCRASLELMGYMLGLRNFEHCNETAPKSPNSQYAAALFANNMVIAGSRIPNIQDANRVQNGDNDDAEISLYKNYSEKYWPIRTGRSSAFFNSLVYWDLMNSDLKTKDQGVKIRGGVKGFDLTISFGEKTFNGFQYAVKWALRNVEKWMGECLRDWGQENQGALIGPFRDVISWHRSSTKMRAPDIIKKNYNESWQFWNSSSENYGIIENKGQKEFHLWRSYGILPSYICPGGEKRTSINNLVSAIDRFSKNPHPEQSLNYVFLSEPGWGKSYLAECVSKYFDFTFIKYSIAQMSSTHELIESLKNISSTQKISKKKVLVFVDEIDAEINGHPVLGLFLEPMDDGIFTSGGSPHRIDPCIWIFAGSKPLSHIRQLPKGRDFLSRISGNSINVGFLTNEKRDHIEKQSRDEDCRFDLFKLNLMDNIPKAGEDKQTEIVYQIVNLLQIKYGYISQIEEDVIKLFYTILPINGGRSLKTFVSKFQNPTSGKIEVSSLPAGITEEPLRSHIVLLNPKWYQDNILNRHGSKKTDYVKIFTEPAD